jgi:hypothetical protein
MVSEKSGKTPWNATELRILKDLDSPYKIQGYLDRIEYNAIIETRSPRCVMRHQRAHCMEGALFATACLEHLGYLPLVVDLKAENDDDHIIAIYKRNGHWGAIAKSNFTTIRYREPVYRSLRELSMSYFDFYFNTLGEKSLRAYSLPHNLDRFGYLEWQTTEKDLEEVGSYLDSVKHIPLITPEQVKHLNKVGDYLLKSSLLGSNPAGLYVPDPKPSPDRS